MHISQNYLFSISRSNQGNKFCLNLIVLFLLFLLRVDKPDSTSAFQRSLSSSVSSLENIASETITCLTFADSYTKKSGECPWLILETFALTYHWRQLNRLINMLYRSPLSAASDCNTLPTLWIGTSMGFIQTIVFPQQGEGNAQPIIVSPCSKCLNVIDKYYNSFTVLAFQTDRHYKLSRSQPSQQWRQLISPLLRFQVTINANLRLN